MRVIAGSLKGRRLVAPRGRDTRPTSDRVRESLFMILGPLEGRRVIDLFAGSGALGIEALSRGAEHVDFVERSAAAHRALEANLASLGLSDHASTWRLELPRGLKRMQAAFEAADLVLVDPPYGGREANAMLGALATAGLRPGATVVLEHHAKDDIPARAGPLRRMDERRYGETSVSLYVVEPAHGDDRTESERPT